MWPRLINVALGIWLMFAPFALGYGDPAANNDRIVGPLVATCAWIALSETTRGLRWLNVPLGGWLLLAPWLLDYPGAAMVNSLVVGLVIIGSAWIKGPLKHQFGGGWRALWASEPQA